MAHDGGRSERDAALRAVLIERAKRSRIRRLSATSSGPATRRLLPVLVTAIVLAVVVALSAGAIIAGQSRFTAASEDLRSSGPPAPTADASSGPARSSTFGGPLIAMDGARALTRSQLHAWTLANGGTSADAAVGEEQDWLTIQCMAELGYLYDPTFEGSQGLELGRTWGLTTRQLQGYRTALWGSDLTTPKRPYDWHDAGCHGRAVHLTGQDDEH